MENSEIAKMLKEKIQEVEQSKKDSNPDRHIAVVHVGTEVFLKMAYLFVGINSIESTANN